jgi:hypothetical protein
LWSRRISDGSVVSLTDANETVLRVSLSVLELLFID